MKLLIALFALVATVASAPQGSSLDTQDVEIVPPSELPTGSSGSGSSPDVFDIPVIFVHRRPSSGVPSLIDLFFGSDPSVDTTPTDTDQPGEDFFTRFFGGSFPSIFTQEAFPVLPSVPEIPEFPNITSLGDLPDGYSNSTHEVKVVDGSRVEINRTVTKTEDNGVIITQVIYRISPDGDGSTEGDVPESAPGDASPAPKEGGTSSGEGETVPESDPADNQVLAKPYEDFDVSR